MAAREAENQLEQLKLLARMYFERFVNGAEHGLAHELLTEDFTFHSTDIDTLEGRENFVRRLKENKATFSNSAYEIEDIIAEGAKVAVRLTFRGTHSGAVNRGGIALNPTGKDVAIKGFALLRFGNGRIAELWVVTDRLAMVQQVSG